MWSECKRRHRWIADTCPKTLAVIVSQSFLPFETTISVADLGEVKILSHLSRSFVVIRDFHEDNLEYSMDLTIGDNFEEKN
jgi:hypothetical protein